MNDIETTKETGIKVHKLPTRLSQQTTLSEEIEEVWRNLEKNLCQEIRRAGLDVAAILGNKHYQ